MSAYPPLKPANIPLSRSANKREAAEFFDVSIPTVEAWVRRGCPVVQRGSKTVPWVFDLLEVAQWRFSAEEMPTVEFDPTQLLPRERRDWYISEKTKLEVEAQKQLLVPADSYRREMAAVRKTLMQCVEMLPDRLSRECGLSDSVMNRIQSVVENQHDELAERPEALTE